MRVPGVRFVQGRNHYGTSTKYGIAIHATANTAPAAGEASYAQRRTDGVSAHLYTDGREVIQSLDTSLVAGHAGSTTGNRNAVAVEITGLNSWTRRQWLDRVAWAALAAALAAVCRAHGILARRVPVKEMAAQPSARGFYTHDDMRRAWGGTDHTDPGPNFPMDHLLKAVADALDGDDMPLTNADVSAIWAATFGKDGAGKPITAGSLLVGAHARAASADARAAEAVAQVALLRAEQAEDAAEISKQLGYVKDAQDAYAEAERQLDELRHAQVMAELDDEPAAAA